MKFKKDFPSLKGKVEGIKKGASMENEEEFHKRTDGTVKWEDEENYLMVFIDDIQKHCLDKKRVRDALERNMILRNGSEIIPKIKKELGL